MPIFELVSHLFFFSLYLFEDLFSTPLSHIASWIEYMIHHSTIFWWCRVILLWLLIVSPVYSAPFVGFISGVDTWSLLWKNVQKLIRLPSLRAERLWMNVLFDRGVLGFNAKFLHLDCSRKTLICMVWLVTTYLRLYKINPNCKLRYWNA